MIVKYIECGQIVSTTGLKGEVRVNYWCDNVDFLKKFDRFYTSSDGSTFLNAVSVRSGGNVAVVKLEGVDSVEDARKLRGTVLYIDREAAGIADRHFIADLIGCTVYDADNGTVLGTLENVMQLPANDVWEIKKENKIYLLPAIDGVVCEVLPAEDKITVRPLKGIFDDED